MSDKSAIEWTDATWNPVTGCDRVSEGCDNCYALRDARRLKAMGSARYRCDGNPKTSGPGFGLTIHPDVLGKPFHWTPRRIFVNSMSDLFHDGVPDWFIYAVWRVMAQTPQHIYQILTKRPRRMLSWFEKLADRGPVYVGPTLWRPGEPAKASPVGDVTLEQAQAVVGSGRAKMFADWRMSLGDPPEGCVHPPYDWMDGERWWPTVLPNVWLGVSVENQRWADQRIPLLLQTPAAVRFLSCEPLLGPIRLDRWIGFPRLTPDGKHWESVDSPPSISWVIVGGESGSGARPMHPDWARTIRDQSVAAGVPYFFKQWGEWSPLAPMRDGVFDFRNGHVLADDGTLYRAEDLSYPDGPRWGEATRAHHDRANLTAMYRVGRKAAGRELDDRVWSEFPS